MDFLTDWLTNWLKELLIGGIMGKDVYKRQGYICPVCFWENDPFIASDNEPSDSNHGITLKEAKSNFSKFGACEKEMLCYVRPPRDDEKEIS